MDYFIFVDDERDIEGVTWINYGKDSSYRKVICRNYLEFREIVNMFRDSGELDRCIYSFDHDLQDFDINGKEKTGYDCLKYMLDVYMFNQTPSPKCYFHSKNVVGCKNMKLYYENFKKYHVFG